MTDLSVAESRFGLGPKGGRPAVGGDPRGWAEAQIGRFQPRLASAIPTRADIAADLTEIYAARREAKQDGRKQPKGAAAMMTDAAMPRDEAQAALASVRKQARDGYVQLVGARMQSALASDTPFVERMVHFWANHFAVSASKVTTVGFAGLLEMEAIRPHVTGSFRDMLFAVERHPAMLFYLDQAQSIGPNSPLGRRAASNGKTRGLNENLAREAMELHTLGVRTGYTQDDVTEFARALTGWTVGGIARGALHRRSARRFRVRRGTA